MEKEVMGADFYTEDYLYGGGGGGGGGYYDGGGGGFDYGGELFIDPGYLGGGGYDFYAGGSGGDVIDLGFDTTSWPTFDQYYGTDYGEGLPPDYGPIPDQAWMIDPSSGFMDLSGGYVYDPSTGGVLDTGLWQGGFDSSGSSDLYGAYLDYYMNQGLDFYEASALASEQAATGSIYTPTYEQAPLPDVSLPSIPYTPMPFDYDFWAGYSPEFFELPVPPPPTQPLPPSPATQQPNLPPYCPVGQYHPYPIGHPQQNTCVPFPISQTPAPQPRPGGQPSGGAQRAPRPPQQQRPSQQQRPPTQQPQQRCTTPGTVFDQARGICVPQGQAISPLPIPTEASDLWANLKELPWWVWLALGGLFLLSRDDGGKKTTVTYRRAR